MFSAEVLDPELFLLFPKLLLLFRKARLGRWCCYWEKEIWCLRSLHDTIIKYRARAFQAIPILVKCFLIVSIIQWITCNCLCMSIPILQRQACFQMTPSDSLKHPALRTSASRVYGPKQDRFELLKFFKVVHQTHAYNKYENWSLFVKCRDKPWTHKEKKDFKRDPIHLWHWHAICLQNSHWVEWHLSTLFQEPRRRVDIVEEELLPQRQDTQRESLQNASISFFKRLNPPFDSVMFMLILYIMI